MAMLEQAREAFMALCSERGVNRATEVRVRPLMADEAVGTKAGPEFAIKRGKEVVIEATFKNSRGQAFTDCPSRWEGTLTGLLSLDLTNVRNRAVFVAAMNAVLRSLGAAGGTVHCRDDDLARCGEAIAREIEKRFGKKRTCLIGLQPAILKGMAFGFGCGRIGAVDLNPDNIGTWKLGVRICDGVTELPKLVEACDLGLATGSTLVNGTIDEIMARFAAAKKPLVFYGNTIAGAAALLRLERLCPFGQ
jgi:hypothetical protein